MMKKILLPFLLLLSFAASAQLNNSWIDYSKTYYKFKLSADNVCRISKSALDGAGIAAATNADYFQLWKNGVQVRLYTSVSGAPLGAADYIEFWGERNDGKADKPLYKKPEFQLADKYSLETDTSTYFLTVNPAGGNLRFATAANTAPSAATPDAYFMRKADFYYNTQLNHGFGKDFGEYVYSAAYDDGEGYTSGEIVSPKTFAGGATPGVYTETQTGLNVYMAGPANSLSARAKIYFNTDNASRDLSIKIGNTEIVPVPGYFNPTSASITANNLSLSNFADPSTLVAKFTNTNTTPSYDPNTNPPPPATPNDRMVIATWGITYPAIFNFNNLKAFYFELAASATGNYLVIDNFNYGAVAPVLYDYTTGRRYIGEIASTPGKVKFVLPASAEPVRQFRLVNEETGNTGSVIAFTARTFIDYNAAANRGDYIIISNPRLYNDGAGNNYVDQYRQYRSSVNGGSFNAKIYDINELTDQFGFGIKKHPAAVRDFARYLDQQYTVKPKFYLLIGRGLTYLDAKLNESNPLLEQLDLVQTFGWPASDQLLVSQPGVVNPLAPVGRIAAINGTELGNYLQKMQQYEAEQKRQSPLIAEKQWMKNAIHIVGGKTENESSQFGFYMDNYKTILEDSLFGGKVETFVKTTVATVQQASSARISQLFEEGLGFIGYFGHSSASVFEFNLSNPLNYNNAGKYPFFNVSGCSAGNFYSFDPNRLIGDLSLSEKYILSNQRGSIGFLADTHFGLPPSLDNYNTDFYTQFCRTMYGQRVGDQIKTVISNIGGNDPELFYTSRWHLEEINLHGDPALRINNFAKPDYAIEDQSIKITPDIISIADPTFHVKVMIRNLGRATNDSIKVYVKRQKPNSTVLTTIYDQMMLATKNTDSLEFNVPIDALNDKGQNQLIVELDYTHKVDELYETNNKITKPFYVFEDEIRPIYPYNYAIVNTPSITYSASTANPLAAAGIYTMELDTTRLFNSPFKKSYSVTSPAGVIQFTPANVIYSDSTVYYWRTGLIAANGNTIWNNSSFTYLPTSTPGFNFAHYYQKLDATTNQISLADDRLWKFPQYNSTVKIVSGIFPTASNQSADFLVDIDGASNIQSACGTTKVIINAINPIGMQPIYNNDGGLPGQYNSDVICGVGPTSGRVYNFQYDPSTITGREYAKFFLNTIVPNGYYVVVRNIYQASAANTYAPQWAADPSPSFYSTLKNAGFTDIDNFTSLRAFEFIYKKGDNSFTPASKFSDGAFDKITLQVECPATKSNGTITSPAFGPAKAWDAFHWRGGPVENPTKDSLSYDIIGIDQAGTESTLFTVDSTTKDFNIASVNAAQYPYLKIRMFNSDKQAGTPYQFRYLRLNYTPAPEGAVAPNISYSMKDTVVAGEPIDFKLAFKNVSNVKFDSLMKIRLKITTAANYDSIINIPRGKILQVSPDTLMLRYTIPSENYPGSNLLSVEFNPDNNQLEQFHFNNFLLKPFYVVSDKFNPLLDVTFDGVHILNRDLVSSKPNILIKLKDENRFLALKDTGLMQVQVRYPDNTLRTFNFNGDTMRFIPANLSAGENAASIELKPYFTLDGDYELIVTGKDVTGNAAGGDMNYHSSFTVINKPMISELLNYPNPFTTSTAFVFTLTGSDIPQNMRIQILTITGKVVREITKNELGPIHIGRNITEFKWDGTDMYGQKLANGVYIYRVLTNLNGKSLDKYKADGDNTSKYFNKGYGKMYLMR